MKKKKISIIIVWVVFLLVVGSLLILYEYNINKKKAVGELKEQADYISGQIPEIIKIDGYAQLDFEMMREARLNSLCLALEDVSTLNRANYIARQFYDVAGIKALAICDEKGKILSKIGDYSIEELDGAILEEVSQLDSNYSIEVLENNIEEYQEDILSSDMVSDGDFVSLQVKKSGSWYIVIEYEYTEEEEKTLDYFKWESTLGRVKIRNSGSILVLDKNDGTILLGNNPNMRGHSLEGLSVKLDGATGYASIEDLNSAFQDTNQVVKLSVAGKQQYAVRIHNDHALMLAMIPVREIQTETLGGLSTWFFLLTLVTGICMLFSLFYLEEENEILVERKGGRYFNKSLSGRLGVCGVLAMLAVLLLGSFLEILTVNAQHVRYNQKKSNEVAIILTEESTAKQKLEEMYREDELVKARIAGVLLGNEKERNITQDYIDKLAECLNVKYCYFYDPNGKVKLTNSPYASELDPNSEFFALLKGRQEVSEGFSVDETTGEYRQKAGVSVLDRNNNCIGALVIEEDAALRNTLVDTLNFDEVLRDTFLKDDTYLLVISDEENIILYFSRINEGVAFPVADSSDTTIADIYFDESKLRDNYSGTVSFYEMSFNASVKLQAEKYIVVMQFQDIMSPALILPVLLEMTAALLFVVLLWPIACFRKKTEGSPQPELKATPEIMHVSEVEAAEENFEKRSEMLAVLSGIADKNKPYFDERWAKDSTKWKDKTAYQKFSYTFVLVCFVAILFIVLQALIMKGDSVWYYCFSGEWDKGINLHSIASCVITICILFYAKILIHKLLYLTARASSARGETVCHLFDSFLVFIMYVVGILICLASFGVDLKTLSVTGGVMGAIISFSCQSILADMLAGVLMAIEGTVQAGDFVTYLGQPGIVYSIGIRTTKLKWYGEITVVRNNDFKDYVAYPSGSTDRIKTYLNLDFKESLERFEEVFEKEAPYLHGKLCEYAEEYIKGPNYLGVTSINDNGIMVCISFFCTGEKINTLTRLFNRELVLMCERNDILLALPQVVVNEPNEKNVYEKGE